MFIMKYQQKHTRHLPAALTTALFFSLATLSISASAANSTTAAIEAAEQKQMRWQRELEFTHEKLNEAAQKLADTKQELEARTKSLKNLEAKLGDTPSESALERLKTERQRVAVAELSVESQSSVLERLERKQADLKAQLGQSEQDIENIRRKIAETAKKEKRNAAAQEAATQREIRLLREENDSLNTELLNERQRLVTAELRIEELVRITDQQAATIEKLNTEISAMMRLEEQRQQAPSPQPEHIMDLSQTVLEGEDPIYQGDDGQQMMIRSRSLDAPIEMTQISPTLFRADIKIEPGRTYFDLNRRRYRGTFPANEEGYYRFYYDTSQQDAPVLSVDVIDESSQMITNTVGDF